MLTIQATDCTGTALVTAATGKRYELYGTVIGQLLTIKTGHAPNGDRNRVLTFIVTAADGTVTTYTRERGGVRNDATGELVTVPTVTTVPCACCGDDVVEGTGRTRTEAGAVERLCRDCLVLDIAA